MGKSRGGFASPEAMPWPGDVCRAVARHTAPVVQLNHGVQSPGVTLALHPSG